MDLKDLNIKKGPEVNPATRRATNYIVIHHAASGRTTSNNISAERIHEIHLNNGWAGIGYHFVIEFDGTITSGRTIDAQGAHTKGHNSQSIGICLSGNMEIDPPTGEQYNSLYNLLMVLCEKYDLDPMDDIKAHRDLGSTLCPGSKTDMNMIRTEVKNRMNNKEKQKQKNEVDPESNKHTKSDHLRFAAYHLDKAGHKNMAKDIVEYLREIEN